MVIFENSEMLDENTEEVIIQKIVQILREHNASIMMAEYLLDQTKCEIKKVKV